MHHIHIYFRPFTKPKPLTAISYLYKKGFPKQVFKKKKQEKSLTVAEIWPKVEKENKMFTRFKK